MKIFYMSDLHLERGPLSLDGFEGTDDDVVILSGDIGNGYNPDTFTAFLKDLAPRVQEVLYIPGNHEFYHGDIEKTLVDMRGVIDSLNLPNVIFNDTIYHLNGDVAFIGATLWTSFKNNDWFAVQHAKKSMADFGGHITKNGHNLHPADSVELFNKHFQHIRDYIKIAKGTKKKIVVFTHHGVTEQAADPRWRMDALQPAFFTNLEQEILAWQPEFWIHGHFHNTARVEIDDTTVLINPRGYIGHHMNKHFNINAHFNL